jgi:tetratricopeptide (TPR) repeat protein
LVRLSKSTTHSVLALAAVALLAGPLRALRVEVLAHGLAAEQYEGTVVLPPSPVLRVVSLGHREALADLIWLRALVYYGDEIRNRGEFAQVFDLVEAIVSLDPEFRAAYLWAATAALYHTRGSTVDDARRAVRVLERAVSKWPEDGELAWELGATLSYELVPLLEDGEEKERARLQGAEHLSAAARLGAGPDWLVFTNATALRRLGRTEQAIRHLEEMYAVVRDPEIRLQIEREIGALRSAAAAEGLREAVREFEEARRREYPYLDDGLYLHVGPRFRDGQGWRDAEEEEPDPP